MPMSIPPLTRNLLMGQANDIATLSCRQIADDIAIEICRCRHGGTLPHRVLDCCAGPRSIDEMVTSWMLSEKGVQPRRRRGPGGGSAADGVAVGCGVFSCGTRNA